MYFTAREAAHWSRLFFCFYIGCFQTEVRAYRRALWGSGKVAGFTDALYKKA